MNRSTCLAAVLLASAATALQTSCAPFTDPPTDSAVESTIPLPGLTVGARHVMSSSILDEERELLVYLPDGYETSPERIGKLSGQAHSQWVFPGRKPEDHLESVRKPWSKIRKRAKLDNLPGLGPLRLHDLRHNVVSWDVSRGVPLEIAGKNVGHRSRRSTEVYAHFAPDALKRAADERARAMREAVEERARNE